MTPAERLIAALNEVLAASSSAAPQTVTVTHTVTATWRERVHACPDDTVLYLDEAGEALGLSKDALRKRLDRRELALPYTVKFGRRVFRAADVRAALREPARVSGIIPLTRARRRA